MTDLAAFKSQVLFILGEAAAGAKFSDSHLTQAASLALRDFSAALPNHGSVTVTVATAGKVQALSAFAADGQPFAVYHPATAETPELQYYFYWSAGVAQIEFIGVTPAAGDTFRVDYGCSHTIEDLESATVTTIPGFAERAYLLAFASNLLSIRLTLLSERVQVPDEIYKHVRARMLDFQTQYRQQVKAIQPLCNRWPALPTTGWSDSFE